MTDRKCKLRYNYEEDLEILGKFFEIQGEPVRLFEMSLFEVDAIYPEQLDDQYHYEHILPAIPTGHGFVMLGGDLSSAENSWYFAGYAQDNLYQISYTPSLPWEEEDAPKSSGQRDVTMSLVVAQTDAGVELEVHFYGVDEESEIPQGGEDAVLLDHIWKVAKKRGWDDDVLMVRERILPVAARPAKY